MELSINIVSLTPKNMGEEAELKIRISSEDSPEKSEERRFTVFSKMLFEIGNIGVNSLPYRLTREQYDTLEYDGEIYGAVKKGMELIAFGDNTARSLVNKLRQRGFDRYISEDAAEYLVNNGYIDEASLLARTVKKLSEKLYGRTRIKGELFKKGFSRDILSEKLEDLLSEIDFLENAEKILEKKCDIDRLSDRKYREGLYAAMYRYGYSTAETKAGIARIKAKID